MADLNWSDAQWQKVNDAVTEAFGKASVASTFLPMYGPLAGSAEMVRNERLQQDITSTPPTISLDKDHLGVNLKLVNVTVNVALSSEQVADETLSNAILAFRRAANILAQEQDRVVFEGFRQNPRGIDSRFVTNNPDPERGLADLRARHTFSSLDVDVTGNRTTGREVVRAVVNAIHRLEDSFNPAPFACVLGNTLFEDVHDPSRALVLPADRITPLLKGGPLLRSGTMDDHAGILVSLSGNAVDLVVGRPPTVQFLQRTIEARFVFRVYERFALRIRDAANPPVAGFRVELRGVDRVAERQALHQVAAEKEAARTAQEIEEQ
jgi:uncharacterized linocin/CFP29 family protein